MQRDLLYTLPEREREAVRALEWHAGFRTTVTKFEPVELEEDGTPTTILTDGHFQRCLRACGATRTGEKFAAECLSEILPRLGLLEDTGRVMKPRPSEDAQARREKFAPGHSGEGGRAAQTSLLSSRWWRVFRLPTLPRLVRCQFGVWLSGGIARGRHDLASLSALFRCQDLVLPSPRRRSFAKGSVQWVFAQSGPP
jgi:hypothetical protein